MEDSEIITVIDAAKEIIKKQPVFLELTAPINILGDIHGQFSDLLRLFEFGGYPPTNNYLFLGDYVDRGKQSIEVMCLLLCYKIKYPENFFFLRGNHESSKINKHYGFYEECRKRYNIRIWNRFNDLFNWLPVAALINEKIFCAHGGLSPELKSIEQLYDIQRPSEVPEKGLLCDILWTDPTDATPEDGSNWGKNEERGVSYVFTKEVVKEFIKNNGLNLICRAHQEIDEGFKFFADKQLVTLFSAPNYCGERNNSGALMTVDKNLTCNFKVLESFPE